jgi:hypothetical protein
MTSIEFLEQNFTLNISVYDWLLLIEKAKEMHRQEIIDAFFEGAYGGDNISGEQYYQETFKK